MAKLTKTNVPGIFRRHVNGCPNQGVVSPKKRCDCNYAVPKRDRGGKQFIETFEKFDQAREAKGRRDAGDKMQKSKVTFGEYFEGKGTDDSEGWIGTYSGRTKRGFEEETRAEYRRSIEDNALPLWRDNPLVDLDQGDVRKLYKAMVDNGKSHSAMKKTRAALSPLFNTAIEDRIINVNIVTGVKLPAPPKEESTPDDDEVRSKALSRDELAALMAMLPEDWHLFFEFLTVTGLRIGEAIGLVWRNVDLTGEKPRVKVREQIYEGRRKRYLKSGAGRRDVPLTQEMAGSLLEHRRDNYGGPDAPVFTSATGTPLRPGNVYRRVLAPAAIDAGIYEGVSETAGVSDLEAVAFGKASRRHWLDGGSALCGRTGETREIDDDATATCRICDDAAAKRARQGLKTAIGFHSFRHTCASLLYAQGRNEKQVAQWLGHANPRFTLATYIHVEDDLGGGLDLGVSGVNAMTPGQRGVDLSVDPALSAAA